jgi:diguanylate cyclase (GGDEF)-like protein/PAS domain S-box-containing protein
LLSDLVDEPEAENNVLLVVTDAHGKIIAHPSGKRIMQSINTVPRMAEAFAAWLSAGGASGGAVEPSGLFLRQPGQVLAMAGVAGPDWLVWRAVPEAELLAPIHAARHKAFFWAILVVAGASLVVLVAVSWLLRPLTLLKRRAMTLFDGGAGMHDGWPEVGGEIGDLARVLRHVGAERAQLEQFNQNVMAKLNSVMASAPLGILFTRAQRFELVSAEFCRLLGCPEAQLLGQSARMIFAASEDYDTLGSAVGAAFEAGRAYVGEWRFLKSDGSHFWGQLRGMPVEAGTSESGTIWTLADISEQVAAREELEWSANHDVLTGLANRKLFELQVAKILRARPASLPAAIVMIDLDRFKPINDTAGHAAGDAVLKLVATAITSKVRSSDLAARLGGDEFALLLPNCPPEAALRIANDVRSAIADTVLTWGSHRLQVGASLGVAALAESTESTSAWVQAADAACYEAKAAGRGVVRGAEVRHLRSVQSRS